MELTGMNFVSRAGLSALDETDIMAAKNSAEALLAVSMDRALAGFRENSGLGTFGAMRFKDWETGEFSSPCLGLYLCACKNAYLSGSVEETTAQKLLERLHDIVEALKECQDVFGTGLIFGAVSDTKNPESVFDASEKGCHEGALQIAGPWHTLGRLIDGLSELASLPCRFDEDLPAAEYVKNTSLDILNRLVDWVFFRASGWNEVTLGLVKGTECGALNESLYHAYSVSEKETHLRAAELFDDTDFYNAILSAESAKEVREKTDDPVSAVKFLGTLRKYLSTHEKKNLDYATAFWEYKNVTKNIDPIELSDLKLLAQMLFEATGSASYANDFEELSSLSSGQTSDFIFADPCEGAMYSGSGMIAVSRYIPFVYEDDYQKLEVTRSSEKEQTYKILFKRTFTGTLSLRIPSGLEGDPEILIDGEEYGFAVAGAKKKTKGFALVAGPFDVGCEVEIRLPGLSTRSDLLPYAGGTYTAPGGDAYISNTYIPKDDSYVQNAYTSVGDAYAQNAYTSAGDAYVQNTYTSAGDAYAQNAYAPKGDTYAQNAYTSPKNAINGADTGAPVTEYSDLYKNENYQSFFTAPDHSVAEAGTIESYGMLDGYKGDDIGSPSQPQNDGFGYGIPSQPQYDGLASDAPAYEKTAYGTPPYDAPSYEKTAYGTPPYDAPSYEKTAYGTPPYDAPSYEKTAYGMPPYDVPAYEKSSYENSAYKAAASENNNGQKVLRAPFELCADAGEVLYSGSRKRFLIKLPQDYSSGELSVSVNADFANIELDSNICPTGSIVLRVDERHFTGHQLRLYTTDDYRDYVDYEIAIMKTGPAYEDGSGQTASANSYREVTGSFAGELCYKIDCLRDEYEDGPLGSYNSRAFQMYGIDPDTGYFWGITGSNSAKCYEFELEDGSYELKLSLMAPEWCHDKPSVYQNPNRSNERLLGENLDSESDNLCYRVNVRDGKLVIGIISDSNEVTIWRLEIRVLSTIAAANDYKPLWETKAAPEFKYTAPEPEYNFTAPEPEQPAYIPPEFSYTEPEYRYTAPEPEYRYTAPEPEYNFTATEPAYTAAESAYLASEAAFGKAVAPEPEQPAYIPPEFSYTAPEPEKPAPAKTVKEETVAEYAVPKTGYAPKPNFIRIVPTIAQGAMPQIRVAEPLIPKPKVTVMHSAEHNAEEGIAQEASKITVETGSGKKISTVAKVTGSIAGAVAIIGGIVSLFKDKD